VGGRGGQRARSPLGEVRVAFATRFIARRRCGSKFLSEGQVARFGRFVADPSPFELERFFGPDGDAWRLVASKRRDENRLGFAVQWARCGYWARSSARTPTGVPAGVVAFLSEQLGTADSMCLRGLYAETIHSRGSVASATAPAKSRFSTTTQPSPDTTSVSSAGTS
jgi:Domain of unknown function (DUF4158)